MTELTVFIRLFIYVPDDDLEEVETYMKNTSDEWLLLIRNFFDSMLCNTTVLFLTWEFGHFDRRKSAHHNVYRQVPRPGHCLTKDHVAIECHQVQGASVTFSLLREEEEEEEDLHTCTHWFASWNLLSCVWVPSSYQHKELDHVIHLHIKPLPWQLHRRFQRWSSHVARYPRTYNRFSCCKVLWRCRPYDGAEIGGDCCVMRLQLHQRPFLLLSLYYTENYFWNANYREQPTPLVYMVIFARRSHKKGCW
jgi:hypothetical protein